MATAVFDLDGCLLDGDSTSQWMLERLRASPWRMAAAIVLSPLIVGFLVAGPTRRWAGMLTLTAATAGLSTAAKTASLADFGERVAGAMARSAGDRRAWLSWKAILRAVTALRSSAALPRPWSRPWLGHSRRAGPGVSSSSERSSPGWAELASRDATAAMPRSAFAQAGFVDGWTFAYSDSADDLPMLAVAQQPFLVAGDAKLARLRRRLPRVAAAGW
jgi:phosphatidylglycerophosphatase C